MYKLRVVFSAPFFDEHEQAVHLVDGIKHLTQ